HHRQKAIGELLRARCFKVADRFAEVLVSESSGAHNLPTKLVYVSRVPLLPGSSIDRHGNSDTVKRHLFHFLPMSAHVLRIGNTPAVIDELLAVLFLFSRSWRQLENQCGDDAAPDHCKPSRSKTPRLTSIRPDDL